MVIEDITQRVDRLLVISNLQKKTEVKKEQKTSTYYPYSTFSNTFHNKRVNSCLKRPMSHFTPKNVKRSLQNHQIAWSAYNNSSEIKKRIIKSRYSESSRGTNEKKSRNKCKLFIRPFTAKIHIREQRQKIQLENSFG